MPLARLLRVHRFVTFAKITKILSVKLTMSVPAMMTTTAHEHVGLLTSSPALPNEALAATEDGDDLEDGGSPRSQVLPTHKADKRTSSELPNDEPFLKKPRLPRVPFIRPGVGDEKYDETSYYIENGLRKVYPYYYTYTSYCKGRWVGSKLAEVFNKEFRALSASQFARSIEMGLITVNEKKVGLDYELKNNDFIANKTHRHEVAVSSKPIKIIHSSDEFFVIDKPSSIPVHPCGRYRHNSITFILGKEFNMRDIKSIHRLDRLTSGLLIFVRSTEKASEVVKEIRSREVEKEYLCRVVGEFPSDPVTCDQPIDVISFKIGISRVMANGKKCTTTFQRLSFNGKSSVVLSRPHTGRMHQIRVHLQFLGFPILNDPIYNHESFGPNKGKGGDFGKSQDQVIRLHCPFCHMPNRAACRLIADLIKAHNLEVYRSDPESITAASVSSEDAGIPICKIPITVSPSDCKNGDVKDGNFDSSKMSYDPNCLECNGVLVYRDPTPEECTMYLHAWKYKGKDWSFESEMPEWAKDNWNDD